jgi:adenylate kinase family enzyme
VPSPQRVLVYGVTGSGKSTLALQIADVLGLPCHLADEEIGWLPGWTERPVPDHRGIAARICAEQQWVLDTACSGCSTRHTVTGATWC